MQLLRRFTHRSLTDKLVQQWRRIPPAWRFALGVFALLKVTFTIIGIIALTVFTPIKENLPPNDWRAGQEAARMAVSGHQSYHMWFSWDSFIYYNLERTNYATTLQEDPTIQRFAFPPLYPLLSKTVGNVLGDRFHLSLLIVSNVAFIMLLYFAYKLGEKLLGNDEQARRFTKYLVLLPAAFIFQAAMTESLFLCLVLACFYYAETHKWWLVGVLGFFASLTRSIGFLLVIPLGLILLEQYRYKFNSKTIRAYLRTGWWLALIPLGWLTFMAYCRVFAGDWFAYSSLQQAGWGVAVSQPLGTLLFGLGERPFISIRAWFAMVHVAIIAAGVRLLSLPYIVYALIFIAMPLSLGPVQSYTSLIRYLVVVFPIALILARFAQKRPQFDTYATVALALVQGALFVLWVNYWTTFII